MRETCAQALGAAFKYMRSSLIRETLNILLQMQVDIIRNKLLIFTSFQMLWWLYICFSLVIFIRLLFLFVQRRPEWEIRHGSLLGIKYLVAVRQVSNLARMKYLLQTLKYIGYFLIITEIS